MTFAIGRRRLVVSFRVEPAKRMLIDLPEAAAATDEQLVRLARGGTEANRQRLETEIALLGYRPIA